MPARTLPGLLRFVLACVLFALVAGCGGSSTAGKSHTTATLAPAGSDPRSGGTTNIYAADRANNFSAVVAHDPALVYVPNTLSNTVTVISQRTFQVLYTIPVGALPQHIAPAWNLRTLYADND